MSSTDTPASFVDIEVTALDPKDVAGDAPSSETGVSLAEEEGVVLGGEDPVAEGSSGDPIEEGGAVTDDVEGSEVGDADAAEKGEIVGARGEKDESLAGGLVFGDGELPAAVAEDVDAGGLEDDGKLDALGEKDETMAGGLVGEALAIEKGAAITDADIEKDGAIDTSNSKEGDEEQERSVPVEAEADAGEKVTLEPVSVPAAKISSEHVSPVPNSIVDEDENYYTPVCKLAEKHGSESISEIFKRKFDYAIQEVDESSPEKPNAVNAGEEFGQQTSVDRDLGVEVAKCDPNQAIDGAKTDEPEHDGGRGDDMISAQDLKPLPVISDNSEKAVGGEFVEVSAVSEGQDVHLETGEVKLGGDGSFTADDDVDNKGNDDNEADADEDDEDVGSDRPARVAILESSEAVKQIMKELEEGEGSRDYSLTMDGQIVLDDSDEESGEVKLGGDGSFTADDDVDNKGNDDNEADADENDEDVGSDRPARVAILESSEVAKQIMKKLEEGEGSRDYSQTMDGQIVLEDSDEEVDDDEGEEKEFDTAALAALLKAASGSSPDGSITVTSQDGARIFSIDRPAGLGSSVPSLRPAAPRQPRPSLFAPSELAVAADPAEDMTDEEKKLHEKVELIRVKFMRLVYRLGHSPEDTVVAQVLYRLSLAEGIRRGRQTNRAFILEHARKKALQLEAKGKEDLNFSCNILVLGKTGVGKSATINSIFGEEKSETNAFERATTSVREIVGTVDGVKIRIIDTPGLQTSVMDQAPNKRILSSVEKYTKRCPPDIVLYVDRMDTQTRDLNDLPLLKTITATLGSSIWFNAIVALTHAASAPPDGPNGAPLTYEVFVAQRSHVVQQAIRQAAGDMRLMNPVALVENHPSCRRNREGHKVLPNGLSWRHQLLLLSYSSKILSEANSLLKLQDSSPGKLFGFRYRSPPLPFLLSSLLQSRAHPKLSADQGGENGDSDIDLDDFSDAEEEEEDEYDQLPPFKPLKKSQIAKLTKEQRWAYFDEYDYRVKLLQKKQWKEELRRLREMKKRGKSNQESYGYGDIADEYDQDSAPATVPVPLPDMVLPPSFDCDSPTHRYRFLEPTSQLLARPVLDTHGWDHDCGYDGVSLEESLAVVGKFPAAVSVQVTKDKKEFSIHLDSSIAAKHGENGSSLVGFDIQTIGRQLGYILRGETKFKNFRKNKTTGGFSVTFLGDIVATGIKIEDQLSIGNRVTLVATTGGVRAQGDTAVGANLEARLRDKDYPIGQALSTLGLSLMKWRGDLAIGANLQSQFPVGRTSKMAVRIGLNNKLSGQITVRTSTSDQLQIAVLGLVPIALSIFKSMHPGESFAY